MNDLIPISRIITGKNQPDGFQIILTARFSPGFPSERAQQVGIAGRNGGMHNLIGRVSPGVTRRWHTFQQGPLPGGGAQPVVLAQLQRAQIAFNENVFVIRQTRASDGRSFTGNASVQFAKRISQCIDPCIVDSRFAIVHYYPVTEFNRFAIF